MTTWKLVLVAVLLCACDDHHSWGCDDDWDSDFDECVDEDRPWSRCEGASRILPELDPEVAPEPTPDSGMSTAQCRRDLDCSPSEICEAGVCQAVPCSAHADCPAETPRCLNAICRVDYGCDSTPDCEDGLVCVEGGCAAPSDVCQFDLQCGGGRVCIDNACRDRCASDDECGGGHVCERGACMASPSCESDSMCGGDAVCFVDRCYATCDSGGDAGACGEGEMCFAGLCRPDVRPRPFCSSDDDCAPGHLCVGGVCRTPCPSGQDVECLRADSQLIRCGDTGEHLLCFTDHELNPECFSASDCSAGQHCIDATCRTID